MEEKVLIVPMQPTPNGRLHIGHGAGTYLRADILGRALRVRGHHVRVITGSDGFENWILAAAKSDGRSPEETCKYYHEGIRRDLHNLGVQLDVWIDPLSEEHYPGYRATHEKTLRRLQETGAAVLVDERVPYSVETGQALMGTWIAGRCPQCGEACGGSSCVFCGAHFQPEELLDPKSRLDDSTLEWKTVQSWFARPKGTDKILSFLTDSGVRPVWMDAVQQYLEAREGRIRLSGPGSWGIQSEMVPDGFVLSNPYYLYSVYCGDVYQKLEGTELHPFHPASGVTTIGVFGNDNSTPGMVAPHVIAQGSEGELKPFDVTVVNGMLMLEGQKCSTSKKHGIWLGELFEGPSGITSDELRFFLVQAPLDGGTGDVKMQALVDTLSAYRQWCETELAPVIEHVRSEQPKIAYTDLVASAVAEQSKWVDPKSLDFAAATAVLEKWMHDKAPESGEWLLGLALLGEPIIPKLAQQIWNQLGFDDTPSVAAIAGREIKPLRWVEVELTPRPELTVDSLSPFVHLTKVLV